MTLLDSNQVSDMLGLTTDALRKWRQLRKGPTFHRVGGSVRYLKKDVKTFIEAGKVSPDAPQRARGKLAKGKGVDEDARQ